MKESLLQNPVFGMAARQFDQVADFMELEEEIRELRETGSLAASVPLVFLRVAANRVPLCRREQAFEAAGIPLHALSTLSDYA